MTIKAAHPSEANLYINRRNDSGFIELIRSTGLRHTSGIFTCKISSRNGLQILHVGVYGKFKHMK